MKYIKIFAFIVIFLSTSIACKRIFKGETTQIYGKITDVETKEPLDSVKISVYWRMGDSVITYSDENGEYDLQFNQEEGRNYKINIRKAYYVYKRDYNRARTYVSEGRLQKKNFKLYKFGKTTVYGIITNKENQKALKNVTIQVIHREDGIESIVKTVKTDERGFYNIDFLRKYYFDTYILTANISGFKGKGDLIRVFSESSEMINFELETE